MKKLILGIFATVLVMSLINSCGQKQDPVEYSDEITYDFNDLDYAVSRLESSIWDTTATIDDVQDYYNWCNDVIDHNLQKLKDTKPLKNDKGYLNSVINFYEVTEDVLDNEYQDILSYYNKDWDDSYNDKIDNLDSVAVDKLIDAEDRANRKQEEFARAFDLKLTD